MLVLLRLSLYLPCTAPPIHPYLCSVYLQIIDYLHQYDCKLMDCNTDVLKFKCTIFVLFIKCIAIMVHLRVLIAN